nr:squalene/phytoene synthase family protein [Microbacterium bovistercoris]
MVTGTTSATDLTQYTRCAQRSAAGVIGAYSTSFGMTTYLFDRVTRTHVRSIYALVRVADEIVDGAAAEAGVDPESQRILLDALEFETAQAVTGGYSANLVVHAFAHTAREAGIDDTVIAPFFASMRRDVTCTEYTVPEVADYIHGSAEVVGLMCLRAFLIHDAVDAATRRRLEEGARRLGAAFQKVNFLRDLSADWEDLGRSYFPGVRPDELCEADKHRILDDIDADLNVAAAAIAELPPGSRAAVTAAHALFSALSRRLRRTDANRLLSTRVRVSNLHKLTILVRARLGVRPRRMP